MFFPKRRNPAGLFVAGLLALTLSFAGHHVLAKDEQQSTASTPAQTDVDRAEHLFGANGVPFLKIANVGEQHHPAWVAIYALAYAGIEVYDPKLANLRDEEKFKACIDWLAANLKQQPNGLWVWEYGFDSTYNDISIKAPWSSAFAQATGIQALLAAYQRNGDDKYLELARKAAQPLFTPIKDGGFLFQSGADIWFEEIPQPADNPGHILNGHMRVLLALKELADITGDRQAKDWLKRGTDTLYRWLPRYDAGYWLRYDLNPQKKDLLFRFANPYGYASHPLPVDKITLRDPMSKQEVTLDVGTKEDAEGANRIAGTHWGQIEQLAGRTVRKLAPAALENKPDELAAPHSYFYLSLPGEWKNNLRNQWFELVLDYYDDEPANITLQQRSIAPGLTFRDMRDGDLHLTGTGQWRRWIVPVRLSDLGYWVGASYADKHRRYLDQIARWDARFLSWSNVATGYANMVTSRLSDGLEVKPEPLVLPKQTPVQPIFDLDGIGVVRQFNLITESTGVYHPFMIADQLLTGGDAIPDNANIRFEKKHLKREPALIWLTNPTNFKSQDGAAIYNYSFDNSYNDVSTKAPWPSSFGQAYVLKSLTFAAEQGMGNNNLQPAINAAANAFAVSTRQGGIRTTDQVGLPWYEEVPNATHVLNAHLVSVPELAAAARALKSPAIQSMSDLGVDALKEHLHRFDSGYWLRYDQNPKKELLLQLDWLSGEQSPLIDEVRLENPQTGHYVRINIGIRGDFEGNVRVSGTEWREEQTVDGKSVRGFANGYPIHATPVPGGTRHNAYLLLSLPDREFADFFDVPPHRLVIRYKDVAKGKFAVKIQSINAGNQLAFTLLRGGVWRTGGDRQWKEASFILRPQDMGWFKGPDYQDYEIKQLQRIADLTKDWFFTQYVERHGYFLDMQRAGKAVIIEKFPASRLNAIQLSVKTSSLTYTGFGFENALDDDAADDYVAGLENQSANYVVLGLTPPASPTELRIVWESPQNFARRVRVSEVDKAGKVSRVIADVSRLTGPESVIPLQVSSLLSELHVEFLDFSGQDRPLLRLMEVK